MNQPLLYSLLGCALAIALEGLCAGGNIRDRLAELRKPRFVPPLWGWVLIGVLYYAICFVVLYRLFSAGSSRVRILAVALTFAVMLINALWNWFFFRSRNLAHTVIVSAIYTAVALLLFASLIRVDIVAAAVLAPYIVYLGYANFWGHALWKLNR